MVCKGRYFFYLLRVHQNDSLLLVGKREQAVPVFLYVIPVGLMDLDAARPLREKHTLSLHFLSWDVYIIYEACFLFKV